jgi:hypothetical protein
LDERLVGVGVVVLVPRQSGPVVPLVGLDLPEQSSLLDVGQDQSRPVVVLPVANGRVGLGQVEQRPAGQEAVRVVVVVAGQPDLLEVVGALHAVGGVADLLDRGQQQADQDRDDRHHHQEFDERKRGRFRSAKRSGENHVGTSMRRETRM